MRVVLLIAGKEVRDGLRNRWVAAATLLLAALALALAFLGSTPGGSVDAAPLAVTVVSLANLSIFLMPLIALLLSFDSIVGEAERGTLALLLAYPLARWQLVVGKFVGHLGIIAFATIVGYGIAGLTISFATGDWDWAGWAAFATLIGTSILLGGSFAAIAGLVSALVRERATAIGIAVGLWLVLVILFDVALLAVLAADKGAIVDEGLLSAILMLNPADVFRLINLTAFDNVATFGGMVGLADAVAVGPLALLAVLAAWIAAPLALAVAVFSRREL